MTQNRVRMGMHHVRVVPVQRKTMYAHAKERAPRVKGVLTH